MTFLPIDIDETKNSHFLHEPECLEILKVFPELYRKVGFSKPWIGYFVSKDNVLVGGGGYKGKPKDSRVEISYGTFKNYEGKGIGTEICTKLVKLSLKTDPAIKITARNLPDNVASARVLQKNGFVFTGNVIDPEDGEVLEWEYLNQHTE
ncbi:hypothetical protein BH23BAC1_BH23BAC1_24450 [soil metagenome]